VKALQLDSRGRPLNKRRRRKTPRPANPGRVIDAIREIIGRQHGFDRIAVGFPGYVLQGVVRTAYNLHPTWVGYNLESALEEITACPVRVINDAEVQGLGHIAGQGVEMMVTLGTGVGSAIFLDGTIVPELEIGHHHSFEGPTYDDLMNKKALKAAGRKAWRHRVKQMVDELEPVWNYRMLYLGGGNSSYLNPEDFPDNVVIVSNEGGLWGGHVLWDRPNALEWPTAS
jgi:polyphosphate glucokinase